MNKATGEEVWQVGGIVDSWSTPLVVATKEGGDELVVIERTKVLGLDPSTGKQLWVCTKDSDYVCPSVIAHDGVAYLVNSRSKAMLLAIRIGGRGDITNSHVLWTLPKWTTRVSTPVYYDGHLYAIDFNGTALCVDAKSGREVYRERLDLAAPATSSTLRRSRPMASCTASRVWTVPSCWPSRPNSSCWPATS